MSSQLIKIAKSVKQVVKNTVIGQLPDYVSFARRVNSVKTNKRICAMTFDDGPMNLPSNPDLFEGKALTDIIIDSLDSFGAKGTFDIIGDTSANYPDKCGKISSPLWSGIKYDHYPDFGKDSFGGAYNCPHLVKKMVDNGHMLSNHGYRHVLFGKKPLIYGERAYFNDLGQVIADLTKLDRFVSESFSYKMKFSRPMHYVDNLSCGINAYDVYSFLGYNYLGASFDGNGWLPSKGKTEDEAFEKECNEMLLPMKKAIEANPDCFCGSIIFQKDGYNMAKRTPVALMLSKQLELLYSYGYRVVTVEQLMEQGSQFADVGEDDALFKKMTELVKYYPVAFRDNTLRLDSVMTKGELAMLTAPKAASVEGRIALCCRQKNVTPYAGAMQYMNKEKFADFDDENAVVTKDNLKSVYDIFRVEGDSGITRREFFEKLSIS